MCRSSTLYSKDACANTFGKRPSALAACFTWPPPMTPKTLRKTLHFLMRLLTRMEVYGAENIPREGPVIIAANHLGLFDVPLTSLAVHREDFTGWVANKHLRN